VKILIIIIITLGNSFFELQIIMKKFFLFFLIVLTILNISRGVILSQKNSSDFQWSPSKLFFSGENHYEYIIKNKEDFKKEGKIILTQNGEYAHGLYVLFYPLQKLNFKDAKIYWLLLNFIFVSLILFILIKQNTKNEDNLIFILLCLSSIPFSSHLKLGQQTLFVMLFLILPFFYKSKFFSVISGISYFKYNIGYALFLKFLISKEYFNLLLSLIPVGLGFLFYFFYVDSNFVSLVFQPFKVAMIVENNSLLKFDLITTFNRLFNENENNIFLIIKYLIIIVINIFLINYSKEIKDNLLNLSFISIIILYCSPHWQHDYVLMFPLLLHSLKTRLSLHSKINLIIILYFFFINKIINFIFFDSVGSYLYSFINFLILTSLIINNFFLVKKYKSIRTN